MSTSTRMAMTAMADTAVPAAAKGAGLSDVPSLPREASAGRLPTGHEWFVLDIPRPPSINRFMNRLGNESPCVQKWREQADKHLLRCKPYPHIEGAYELRVVFPLEKFGKFDAGSNFLKALEDWMQSREIIQNDRLNRQLVVTWGYAPEGCRIHVRPWSAA